MSRSLGLMILLAVLVASSGCDSGRPKNIPFVPPPPKPVAKAEEKAPAVDATNPPAPTSDATTEKADGDKEPEAPAEPAVPPAPRPSLLLNIMVRPLAEVAQSSMASMQGGIQPLLGAARIPGLGPKKPAESQPADATPAKADETKPAADAPTDAAAPKDETPKEDEPKAPTEPTP